MLVRMKTEASFELSVTLSEADMRRRWSAQTGV